MNNQWHFEADFIQACNCDFGCPCEFSAPPTRGFCEGMVGYRIKHGRYGDVPLDGLGIAMAVHWPKAIHEGNGTGVPFIDERANPSQREALTQIMSGQAGGLPFEIIAQTLSILLDPQFVPIQFQMNGRNSSLQVGDGAMNIVVEPIKNPVSGEPESVRVQHATGFIFKEAECLASRECVVNAGPLKFSCPNKAAFVATVSYRN